MTNQKIVETINSKKYTNFTEIVLVQHVRKNKKKSKVRVKKYNGGVEKFADEWYGKKIGTFVAVKAHTGRILIGWSKCHKRDKFNAQAGIELILARLHKRSEKGAYLTKDKPTFPKNYHFKDQWSEFRQRCIRYFKVDHHSILEYY